MNSQIDIFPEINHELMIPLQSLDDFQICQKWEHEPHKYRYLLAIFCRYYQLTDTLKIKAKYAELVTKYYVQLWYFIFDRLLLILPSENYNLEVVLKSLIEEFCSREEIIENHISAVNSPPQNDLRYLPLQYFLEKALNKLYPLERIIIITKDNFAWDEGKILEYLHQQKKDITLSELKAYYTQAHSRLINALPTDIITIYLNDN